MLEIFKCIAEGIAANGVKGLLEMVPGGKYIHEVGAYAIKRWREKKNQKKLEEAVKEVIVKKADEALEEAKKAVEEAAPQLGEREKELVAQYLAGIADAARQSLKRKDDPTGTSLPPGFTIHEPHELVRILPQHPPRFAAGEWVPGREDNWQLERKLGGGGFGEVWLAQHHFNRNEKPRAVKFCTDPHARTRLVTHEKQLVVQVMRNTGQHPNIVPLLECNLSGETPWLMYEYVPGGTLADAILAWYQLAPDVRLERTFRTLHAIASAVGHCHSLNPAIVHRDLKPANILMDGDIPRVTDFGIGGTAVDYLILAERTGGYESVIGRLPSLLSGSYSLMYASPQQRNRERPDPRDDVHALGVIAYQMLVGRLDAEVKGNWSKRLRSQAVPDDLIELIGASVSDEVADRPADARAWQDALVELTVSKNAARPVPPTNEVDPDEAEATGSISNLYPEAHDTGAGGEADSPERGLPSGAEVVGNEQGHEPESNVRDPFDSIFEPDPSRINLTVPGKLFSRLDASESGSWRKLADAPVEFSTQAESAYRFVVAPTATLAKQANLGCLKDISTLRELIIKDCAAVTDSDLIHVSECLALVALDLSGCSNITDRGVAHLALPRLQVLDLSKCGAITGSGFRFLNTLDTLKSLCLRKSGFTDRNLCFLSDLPSLNRLDLSSTKITGTGFAELDNVPALEFLNLGGTAVSAAGSAHAHKYTALRGLALSGCKKLTDDGVFPLKEMNNLTFLNMSSCKLLTDTALWHIRALNSLETLYLEFLGQVTDTGVENLSGLTTLTHISLKHCTNLTDASLGYLSDLIHLKFLDLGSCRQLTDSGLKQLRGLRKLISLNLAGCPNITDAGIAALKEALPKCLISKGTKAPPAPGGSWGSASSPADLNGNPV